MITIKKQNNNLAQPIPIALEAWGKYNYNATVNAFISYDDIGFCVRFVTTETEPTRVHTKHFDPVHEDSCVEFFANFDPIHSDRYINFEVNANGAMNPAFRKDRYDSIPLKLSEIHSFDIKIDIEPTQWTATYRIPFDFIKSYYPHFDIKTCRYITGNLYKCGDETPVYHLLTCFPMPDDNDDFHNPSAFQKISVEPLCL